MEQREKELLNRRIAVVGIGGVGGYLAGMLGKVCPHLTLAARGARREALLKHGLVLHSDYSGEICVNPEHVVPVSEMEEQDCIFVCVKNYSLDEVCREMEHAVSENTVIVPVMNGADPGDHIRSLIGKGTVVDSLIYIVAFANEDFSITQQGDFANLRIGIQNADEKQREANYKQAVNSCDCTEWIRIIKTLWRRNRDRMAVGKKVTAMDKKYFKLAQDNLYSELSMSLHIPQESMEDYIAK